jgi:hypothetical protein
VFFSLVGLWAMIYVISALLDLAAVLSGLMVSWLVAVVRCGMLLFMKVVWLYFDCNNVVVAVVLRKARWKSPILNSALAATQITNACLYII